jgi:hypothetical protein
MQAIMRWTRDGVAEPLTSKVWWTQVKKKKGVVCFVIWQEGPELTDWVLNYKQQQATYAMQQGILRTTAIHNRGPDWATWWTRGLSHVAYFRFRTDSRECSPSEMAWGATQVRKRTLLGKGKELDLADRDMKTWSIRGSIMFRKTTGKTWRAGDGVLTGHCHCSWTVSSLLPTSRVWQLYHYGSIDRGPCAEANCREALHGLWPSHLVR